MSLAVIHSRALDGLNAAPVSVEVHLANGLPAFTLVGLAETEVKESRERVRAALLNSGLSFPHNKRITVNLAPADLPKEGGRFDLPIALGILAASGQLDMAQLDTLECAGELSLAGELRPVRGALAMSLALRHAKPPRRLVLPLASAAEAALVPGVEVLQAAHLLELVAALAPGSSETLQRARAPDEDAAPAALPDLDEVKGQAGPKRALEIAAAGELSVLLVGPPGSGKSMLAQRLPGLLPPLSEDESLESGRHPEPGWPVRRHTLGSPRAARAAPHRLRRGSGRRRLAASPGRNLAGPAWRAVSGRTARVPAPGAGGAARTAGDRPHPDRPRGAQH